MLGTDTRMNRSGQVSVWDHSMKNPYTNRLPWPTAADTEYEDEPDVFGDAGLNYDELELMYPEERRLILIAAGLNPDIYAF